MARLALPSTDLQPAGRVIYGDRAFEQDAHEAMGGDIIRGLIELITNADDAYTKMGSVAGKIRVEVEHRRGAEWHVLVKDRATGMTQTEMVSRIINLGGRTSGFEHGQAVRGNLGRGAKDVAAFGPTLFESIKDDQFAALRLLPNGDYEQLPRPRPATREDRQRLGIPRGSGTVVTVAVRSSVRCPQHGTLKKNLSLHFQLRDINADPEREVVLVNLNNPAEEDRLRHPVTDTEVLRSLRLVLPGYPLAAAVLEVRRLPERCEDAPTDPYRPGGILIKGRRALYENTSFSFEGNPYAASLHGRLVCEHIDDLAEEYDNRRDLRESPTTDNPMPIINRSRRGLEHQHPFYVALRRAVDDVLLEITREEEERIRREAARIENERTRRNLAVLAREAGRFMQEELRNAEAEEIPSGPGIGAPEPLIIVPGEAICFLGETRTLTIIARREGLDEGAIATVSLDPEGVVELVDGSAIPLRSHRRRSDVMVGQIRVQPLVPELTLVQCDLAGRYAEALVEVREDRDPPPPPPLPPATLEFERPRYRIGWTRTKILTLRSPRNVCDVGSTAEVSSSAAGVAVITGRVSMEHDSQTDCSVGFVRVEGRALGTEATIQASFAGLIARCRVVVTRDEEGPNLEFKLEDKDGGKYRALWEDREDPLTGGPRQILEIQGRHPALRRYLGDPPEFPGQDTPWAKLLIAEIVADNVCRLIARRIDALRGQEERPDSEGSYAEHYGRMLKLLPRLHELMLPSVPE